MSVQTAISRFIFPPKTRVAALYQHLIYGISYDQLGRKLIGLLEQSRALRRFDLLSEYALVLSNLPRQEYQAIGQYYLALSLSRSGQGELSKAIGMLEEVANIAPPVYRAEAMISLSTISFHRENTGDVVMYCEEAAKLNVALTNVKAATITAILKSSEGYHRHALKDLESLHPLALYAPPHVYFDYLNSLAVELGKVSHNEEARNIIRHVLASPFAFAYPEWQQTAEDLRGGNRSFVTVGEKPVSKPVTPILKSEPEEARTKPAGVLMFPHKLKQAPPPEKPDAVSPKELGQMTEAEKRGLLLSLIHSAGISEQEYNQLLVAAGLVKGGPAANEINLEDKVLLDNIISVWCNLIEPEQFAAVMSALRDCKDDWRRNCIIDWMIAIAFQQTSSRAELEHEWRLKVECRLPEK